MLTMELVIFCLVTGAQQVVLSMSWGASFSTKYVESLSFLHAISHQCTNFPKYGANY